MSAMTLLSIALVIVFFVFGVAKFARYEQDAVAGLVMHHPILGLGPKMLGAASFSMLLGTVELFTGVLLLLGLRMPKLGMYGGLLGVFTFVMTLSLFPFVPYFETGLSQIFLSSIGQFLSKDVVLLAACLVVAQHNAQRL